MFFEWWTYEFKLTENEARHAWILESWQKPLRERTSTPFSMKTETLVFADIPDYPAMLKDLLTGFWRTVTLLAPSFLISQGIRHPFWNSLRRSF